VLAPPVLVWFDSTVADDGGAAEGTHTQFHPSVRVAVDALLLISHRDVRHRKELETPEIASYSTGSAVGDRASRLAHMLLLGFHGHGNRHRSRRTGAGVSGEAPTAALGFGARLLLWRVGYARRGHACADALVGGGHIYGALTLPAAQGRWRGPRPLQLRP
jgi:hypothetical protein